MNDTAYCDSEDLAKRIVSDKILEDRAYEVAINSKYDGYQKALRGMVYTFFDKKTGSGVNLSIHKELDQELRKPVTKIFKRRRVYTRL